MEISQSELEKKIKNGEKLIVEFWAPWCGPCRMMKPTFERVSEDNQSDVQMYTMDIDNSKEYVMSLGVKSIPTVKIYDKGSLVETKVGVLQETQIKQLVSNLLLN